MRLFVLLLTTLLTVAACGDSGDPETPAEASAAGMVIEMVSFETSEVVLRNAGSEPYDLTGHALCNRPSYLTIDSQIVEPGESVSVDASGLNLSSGGGEVGFYTANNFSDAGSIIGYVQWGSDSHGRTDTAVEAGVWTAGDFVAGDSASIVSSGSSPNSAADWATQ